jgi:hypothetical protein
MLGWFVKVAFRNSMQSIEGRVDSCIQAKFDTTVSSPFHILYHFDNLDRGVGGVANIILKS